MGARHFIMTQDEDGAFAFKGELTIHDLDYFKDILETAGARVKTLTLSFAEVEFADTASIQFLTAFRRHLGKKVEWKIKALSPEMEKLLLLCGVKDMVVS